MNAQRWLYLKEKVFLHAITDGRDTSPYGGVDYVRQTELALSEIGIGQIATVVGRYYAMDRDRFHPVIVCLMERQ